MVPLANKEHESYVNQKNCNICKEELEVTDDKNYYKVRDHCHYTGKYRDATRSKWNNLIYKIPKEIPAVFHNGSNYGYQFMIKEPPKEFKGQFECIGENIEIHITCSVTRIKKKLK